MLKPWVVAPGCRRATSAIEAAFGVCRVNCAPNATDASADVIEGLGCSKYDG